MTPRAADAEIAFSSAYLDELQRALTAKGVGVGAPLTADELGAIEATYGFTFPPDLRQLLAAFVPEGDDFPDWHRPQSQDLIEWFDYPADGLAFDVEENGFWLPAWGQEPEDVEEAAEEARRRAAMAPILIPLSGHRFLPAAPVRAGNPVFSVTQSDVVILAPDLASYFRAELGLPGSPGKRPEPRRIDFWSELSGAE